MINTSKLMTRLLSAIILGPLVLFIIYLGGIPFLILGVLTAFITLSEWLNIAKKSPSFTIMLVKGWLYTLLAFASFMYLRTTDHGMLLTFTMLITIWASDSGAYFFGKLMGKHPLAASISPNKTWEGFGGAMFFAALFFTIMFYGLGLYESAHDFAVPKIIIAIAVGGCLGATGQIGDLFISIQKRKADVKDTGNLIPGHGGILDRIDALMLACPVYLAIMMIWGIAS